MKTEHGDRTITGALVVQGGLSASTSAVAITGNHTLALANAGKVVEVNSATTVTITVPPNSSVAFPIGTTLELYQQGAGMVTVAAGAGVTIRSLNGVNTAQQFASASLRKRATDEWVLLGQLV
jgi:hypothetical protein